MERPVFVALFEATHLLKPCLLI